MKNKIMNAPKYLILFVFAVLNSQLKAQIKLESWRDQLSFTGALQVVEADNRIYCATPGGLFYFNKTDNSINKFTRVQGLSDIGISALAYSKTLKLLLVGYVDGNIDMVANNQITNISDIVVKANLGNKTINQFYINNTNAYISCGFGIVLLNLSKREITDTYYFYADNGSYLEVFAVALDAQSIYAATAAGLRKASLSDPNLFNAASWSVITDIPNNTKKFSKVIYLAPNIIALYSSDQGFGDRIYYSSGSGWQQANANSPEPNFYSLESSLGQIIVSGLNHCCIFDSNLHETDTVYWGNPRYSIIDQNNLIWIADPNRGMIRITLPNTTDLFIPNGPLSPKTYSVLATKNKVLVLGGGTDASWNNRFFSAEMSFFENQTWTHNYDDSIWDPLNAVFDPANPNHVYIASWGFGIIELLNHKVVKIYNEKNSSLTEHYSW